MAVKWIDSCAAYSSGTDVLAAGYTGSLGGTSNTGGRFSTGSIILNNTAQTLVKNVPSASSYATGFVFRISSNTGNAFWGCRESATVHLQMSVSTSTGRIQILRNGTLLASGGLVSLNVNYAFHILFTINDTTGSIQVWQDDVEIINQSNIDTRNGGSGIVDNFYFTQSGGGNTEFSEIYINDTTGSAPNNTVWLGYRIEARIPNAAGNYAQWTPLSSTNVSNVDEQRNDGDTTYNSSSTAGQKDSFQFSAITPTTGSVMAVQHRIVARKDDGGTRTIRPIQRQSSTDYNGTSVNLTTSYAAYTEIYETNPATAAAFTVSEMRATTPEFGYELVA